MSRAHENRCDAKTAEPRPRLGRRSARPLVWTTAALTATALFVGAGCRDGDSRDSAKGGSSTPTVGEKAGFPRPSSRSMRALLSGIPRGPELAPSVSVLQPGKDRFGFALFDRGNRQIGDLKVALYLARGLDEPARGPFFARYEPIEVSARYQSRQTVNDPDSARSVYVAEVSFPTAGGYSVVAVAELGHKLVATSPGQVMVSEESRIPAVGDRAIRVHTPTRASVGGDIKSIETRVPPDTMHEVDLARALDRHHPVMLLFSTPALCQSRVCGPVTDVAEQVKPDYAGRVDFIHMEIYRDNDPEKGLRPEVSAWGLRTEPFAFTIDSRGVVRARLEGAFGADELRSAVRAALR